MLEELEAQLMEESWSSVQTGWSYTRECNDNDKDGRMTQVGGEITEFLVRNK